MARARRVYTLTHGTASGVCHTSAECAWNLVRLWTPVKLPGSFVQRTKGSERSLFEDTEDLEMVVLRCYLLEEKPFLGADGKK